MGVVNVTPDSFSDGGRYLDAASPIDHGLALAAGGADSSMSAASRPGPAPTPSTPRGAPPDVPVVRAWSRDDRVPVSIDTTKAAVAAAALEAGATIVNDVSGGRADPDMLRLVAEAGAAARDAHAGHAAHDAGRRPLRRRRARGRRRAAGPGRAPTPAGIARRPAARRSGYRFGEDGRSQPGAAPPRSPISRPRRSVPLLVGTSRKSFLGRLRDGAPVDRAKRRRWPRWSGPSIHGAAIVRVHDVAPSAAR